MSTKLDVKQWAIASIVVFVIMTIFNYVPMKLEIAPWMPAGSATPPADDMTRRILIYLGRLIGAGLFAYIYTKTLDNKSGLAHGVRYGLGISLLMYIPWLFSSLALGEWPFSPLLVRTIVGIIETVVSGAAVAYFYKSAKPATT